MTTLTPQISSQHYQFGGCDMELETSEEVFQPTLTSRVLARSVTIPCDAEVLDLGCGVGVLAIVAAMKGAAHVDAVDVMPQACALVQKNARRNGVGDKISAASGDLFENVGARRYDVIISDVSGVVDEVARLSPWYPLSIPTGGRDGADVIVRLICESADHLRPSGTLYFATGTISNVKRTLDAARDTFGDNVELVEQVEVPFHPNFNDNMAAMTRMRDEGLIDFTVRRSRHLWTLQIYRAWLP